MRYIALATDYDGTLAHDGEVASSTIAALERVHSSGRKLLLVTGRLLPDLLRVLPRIDLFDRVIVENGAVVYDPATKKERLVAEPASDALFQALNNRGVPVDKGRAIISTWQPHESTVLELIRTLGLELHVVFNKGAVMILPTGINKDTGVCHALEDLKLSSHNLVGIGDAENDHAFLNRCECAVAVANAIPSLKERADVVMNSPRGEGVVELIEHLIANDLAGFDSRLERHKLSLGTALGGDEIKIVPTRAGFLFAGPSGSGKSSAVRGLVEQISDDGYQFCLIDPEGDYDQFKNAVGIGSPGKAPEWEPVIDLLSRPNQNVIVSLLGLSIDDRPQFFAKLLPRIQELRTTAGRPHWLIIDEAHHMLPADWTPASTSLPENLTAIILVTVHPEHISPAALQHVDVIIAIGKDAGKTLEAFARAARVDGPNIRGVDAPAGEALLWQRAHHSGPLQIKTRAGSQEHQRHLRKYAHGELSEDRSFYFRGPEGKLNLRAQNLRMFVQLANGVDEETWMHHLHQRDYSTWMREMIKDEALATEINNIEEREASDARNSRESVRRAIEQRYTAAP